MTSNLAAAVINDTSSAILQVPDNKDAKYRLGRFVAWLGETGRAWHEPDLAAYRDHLLRQGKAPATVSAHLSTIRGRYARLVKNDETRTALYTLAAKLPGHSTPADAKAFVDETVTRIQNAIDAKQAPVKVTTKQDRADSEHRRLTSKQASALLATPGVDTLAGLRDTAVIGMLLCTGIREAELSGLDVGDLRQKMGGKMALRIREGKGKKQRLVPYGELDWVLAIVDRWLAGAGIEVGPVFRGVYKNGYRLRPGQLSVRAIEYILASYPIMISGHLVTVAPHDCRRTYARRLYEAGMDVVAIQQNLGHAHLKTTLGYIGTLDADKRQPPKVYDFDLAKLNGLPKKARLIAG